MPTLMTITAGPNDTLQTIARRFGVTPQQLAQENGTGTITPGMEVRIPIVVSERMAGWAAQPDADNTMLYVGVGLVGLLLLLSLARR